LYRAKFSNSERLWEPIAEYFSGCLLMEKRVLKSLFCQGRAINDLAEQFDVRTRAIEVRLAELGRGIFPCLNAIARHEVGTCRRASERQREPLGHSFPLPPTPIIHRDGSGPSRARVPMYVAPRHEHETGELVQRVASQRNQVYDYPQST